MEGGSEGKDGEGLVKGKEERMEGGKEATGGEDLMDGCDYDGGDDDS